MRSILPGSQVGTILGSICADRLLAQDAVGNDLGLRPTDPIRVELLGAPSDLAKLSPLTQSDIETTGTIALSKYNELMVVSPRASA